MATITSAASGNSNVGATWVGGVVPGPDDDVVIAGHVITLTADHTWLSLTISNAAGRVNPSTGTRVLTITSFWLNSVVITGAACTPPASTNFTVNISTFETAGNQTKHFFLLSNSNVQLTINSNNAIPTEGNLLNPASTGRVYLVNCTAANSSATINGYFSTPLALLIVLFNFTGGTLVHNVDIPNECFGLATAKYFICSGTGVLNATLGPFIGRGQVSTTGLVSVNNVNATVTINGNAFLDSAGGAGALLHILNGVLALNGKATHLSGTNTLTISLLGGTFRWNNQTRTINADESFTLYATTGLLDIGNLVVHNNNKFVGILTNVSTYASTGFTVISYGEAVAALNFVEGTYIKAEDPPPVLPSIENVAGGVEYGYPALLLTGTGLVVAPAVLAAGVSAALDNISETALARFVNVDTGETEATAGSVASFGGGAEVDLEPVLNRLPETGRALAAADYTAPPTANQNAEAVRTELTPELESLLNQSPLDAY